MVRRRDTGRGRSPPHQDSQEEEEEERASVRSPLVCQCSCHDRTGRGRSPMRNTSEHRSRNGGRYDDYEDGYTDDYDNEEREYEEEYGRNYRDKYTKSGSKMPPIEVNDKGINRSVQGGYNPNNRSDNYNLSATGSGGSHLSVTSPTSSNGRRSRNKPPFRYTGRSLSAGNLSGLSKKGATRNEYDYAHENFLTGPYTSEYQARYEMRMAQRYNVKNDKSIHFIDPVAEHVLIPKKKTDSGRQRRNSDSDILRNSVPSKNNNSKLDPLDNKKVPENSMQGAASHSHAEPGRKQSPNSLPPLEKSPSRRSSTQNFSMDVHPLGLKTPTGRRSKLDPI